MFEPSTPDPFKKSNDKNEDFTTWMSDAIEPKLTPCEKTKNSKIIKFSQFSSKACNDINVQGGKKKTMLKYLNFPICSRLGIPLEPSTMGKEHKMILPQDTHLWCLWHLSTNCSFKL
jgi:hypothetical protein